MASVQEILSKHIRQVSEDLQQKLGDLKASYEASYSTQELTNVLSTQVKVLEGKWEVLNDLEDELKEKALL